jgi:membrane protein implicated in regulation of membrane protease activity
MRRSSLYLVCTLLLIPVAAPAYIGPGAGLSLLGALWALLVAIVTALAFVIAWPLRRMLRRRRAAQTRPEPAPDEVAATPPEAHLPRADEARQGQEPR